MLNHKDETLSRYRKIMAGGETATYRSRDMDLVVIKMTDHIDFKYYACTYGNFISLDSMLHEIDMWCSRIKKLNQ